MVPSASVFFRIGQAYCRADLFISCGRPFQDLLRVRASGEDCRSPKKFNATSPTCRPCRKLLAFLPTGGLRRLLFHLAPTGIGVVFLHGLAERTFLSIGAVTIMVFLCFIGPVGFTRTKYRR